MNTVTMKLRVIVNQRTVINRREFTLAADVSHIDAETINEVAYYMEKAINDQYPQVRVHASIEQE